MPTRPPSSYGSFCPVAQASEVMAQRWVPLIIREIMVGYHRFNEIRRALPLISPSVLAQRLKTLEDMGVIVRRSDPAGVTYHLSPSGKELVPIIKSMGQWARKWITREYRPYELDPGVMMWALRRHVCVPAFPAGRTVIHFVLEDQSSRSRYWWIVVNPAADPDVDVCRTDPGFPVGLTVSTTLLAMADVLVPRAEFSDALRDGLITATGDRELVKKFETLWEFGLGTGFMDAELARSSVEK